MVGLPQTFSLLVGTLQKEEIRRNLTDPSSEFFSLPSDYSPVFLRHNKNI